MTGKQIGKIIKSYCHKRSTIRLFRKNTHGPGPADGACYAIAVAVQRIWGGKLYGRGYSSTSVRRTETRHFFCLVSPKVMIDGHGEHRKSVIEKRLGPGNEYWTAAIYEYDKLIEQNVFWDHEGFMEAVYQGLKREKHEIANKWRARLRHGTKRRQVCGI